jgi:hypothetical protein
MLGLGFKVWGSDFKDPFAYFMDQGLGLGFHVWGSDFRDSFACFRTEVMLV